MKGKAVVLLFLLSGFLFCQDPEPLIFGIVPTSPPVMYLDEKGNPSGFAVELFIQAMKTLHISYEFRVLNFEEMYRGLLSREVDFFPALLYSEERAEALYYAPDPVGTSWGALFVNEKSTFKDIYDIRHQLIGIVSGDRNGSNFEDFIKDMDIPCRLQEYENYNDLFEAVREEKIFGGISSNHHQRNVKGIKQTSIVFRPEPVYCVTGIDNPNREAVERIAAYVQQLKSEPDSLYYRLEEKWYYPATDRLSKRLKLYLLAALIAVFLFIIHIFAKNFYLSREVQRQLEEREKEEDKRLKVELKNDFLSSISHELRTPMNIITSLAYLLSQTNLDANQREKIEQINNASHLLLDIINNFLDFNRLEKGKVELEERTFSLKEELNGLLTLFTEEIKKKGLCFEIHMGEGIPPYLRGDPYRLSQIITNLMNNAIKFSSRGTIVFSADLKGVSGAMNLIEFSIKDDGIGIEPDKQKKLFTPFSQADSSITRQFGGSGLGLAICSELIRLMGGTVMVRSLPGEGTIISFIIPFAPADEESYEPRSPDKRLDRFQGARLLYAEDNRINRDIGKELFRMAGLQIETVENGQLALERTDRNRYDLILMDIQMPVMDGLTATGLIRERERREKRKPIPIVALSAHFLDEDIRKAREAGMDDYLTKPISLDDLNNLFHKWLEPFCLKTRKVSLPEKYQYPPIPGIDMDEVLERFDGNYELILDSLGSFINDYALTPAQLLSLAGEADREKLSRLIHTLKGVLGSLGAASLFEEVCLLEEDLKNNRKIPDRVEGFSHNLEEFISRLEGNL